MPLTPASKTTIGVYRWDAYHGGDGIIYRTVQECLRPESFRDKLPFFGRLASDGTVALDGTAEPETMAAEIRYAADGGVDYSLFVSFSHRHFEDMLVCHSRDPRRFAWSPPRSTLFAHAAAIFEWQGKPSSPTAALKTGTGMTLAHRTGSGWRN